MRRELEEYFNQHQFIQVMKVNERRDKPVKGLTKHANLREILPDEIVIEVDCDSRSRVNFIISIITMRLKHRGINFSMYDHGGRSPHIHIYNIYGLAEQEQPVRSFYKLLFLEEIAPYAEVDVAINTKTSNLIAVEHREHFKHGNIKELVYSTDGFDNKLDLDILQEAFRMYEEKQQRIKAESVKHYRDFDNSWVIEWAASERLPWGKWNNIIAKNVAIVIVNSKLPREETLKKFDPADAQAIRRWFKWVEDEHRYFGYWEIVRFCELYGIDVKSVKKTYEDTNNESRSTSKRGNKEDEREIRGNVDTIRRSSEQKIFDQFRDLLFS